MLARVVVVDKLVPEVEKVVAVEAKTSIVVETYTVAQKVVAVRLFAVVVQPGMTDLLYSKNQRSGGTF